MTQNWTKSGKRVPVTIVKFDTHTVLKLKTVETDGYNAVALGIGEKKAKHTSKPLQGMIHKAGLSKLPKVIKEIRLSQPLAESPAVGADLSPAQMLKAGDIVTVTGKTKGKGFAGVVKRWGFAGGPRTHGQSDRMRAPGSIGQGTTPGRVYKGKKMPGRMGNENFLIRNLTVLYIDEALGEAWVQGTLPGATGTLLTIKKTGESEFSGLVYQPEIAITPEVVSEEVDKNQEVTQQEA